MNVAVVLQLLCLLLAAASAASAQETLVNTTYGMVSGAVNAAGTAVVFRGIPFAAPPVGTLRWADPQPPAHYQGVYEATTDFPGCMQWCQLPPFACPASYSEDCLGLNVFTPRGAPNSGAGLPTAVYLYGGNFFQGANGVPLYDGSSFASQGVVMVVLNYRLGVFGFAARSGVMDGDYGIKDQVAGLRWVQQNIRAFGGDPSRVTVVGQSAGAMSIAFLLSYPPAAGLFHQAVMQSEPFGIPFRTQENQDQVQQSLASYLSCDGTDLVCMRAASAQAVLDAQNKLRTDILVDPNFLDAFVPFTPTAYGGQQPLELLLAGNFTAMPIMIGNTAQEATLFVYEAFNASAVGSTEYGVMLDLVFNITDGPQIASEYSCTSSDCRPLMSQVTTDSLFLCANRNFTRTVSALPAMESFPVFYYLFDHPAADTSAWGNDTFCYNVTCHGSDIPFVWDEAGTVFPATPAEKSLAAMMNTAWVNFISKGDPGFGWPAYDASSEVLMHFVTPSGVIEKRFDDSICSWWDAHIGYSY